MLTNYGNLIAVVRVWVHDIL